MHCLRSETDLSISTDQEYVYILKRKGFATLIKCKFLIIGSNVSFGDITIDKSSSLPRRQHENQNAVVMVAEQTSKRQGSPFF